MSIRRTTPTTNPSELSSAFGSLSSPIEGSVTTGHSAHHNPTQPDQRSGYRRTLLTSLLLAACTLAAYAPILSNGFVNFDDQFYIVQNPDVNRGFTTAGVVSAFSTTTGANWHPLTMLSHMLDCQLFGLDARWHHLVSLLIHIITGVMLLLVLVQMTSR